MQKGERKFGYSRAQVVITWIAAGHPRMALGTRNALPAIVCPFHKYIVQLEEIHPMNWKKYISPIEQMHFSYCTTRKGCNSCVLGGRAFPLCAESPHPTPCQSLRASLTNTLQNFEQILLLNIRQNLPCTRPMTCSLSCFICRLDRACKITHPWWLRQAKIYHMNFRFWGLLGNFFLYSPT